MKISGSSFINDHLFHQTLACPLKLAYTLSENREGSYSANFSQRNKLAIRNAIAQTLTNPKFTSDETLTAEKETLKWLKKKEVTICGAVLRAGDFITRIPILKKAGNQLTIVQVHGKLIRRAGHSPFNREPLSYSALEYLLKAAYRLEVTSRAVPGSEISCEFIFPLKHFSAEHEALFSASLGKKRIKKHAKAELQRLYTVIEETAGTEKVRSCIPDSLTFHKYENISVAGMIEKVSEMINTESIDPPEKIHSKCKYCHFRKNGSSGEHGCWETHFPDQKLKHPELHLFELIGHGEEFEVEEENFFREQVDQPAGLESVQKVLNVPLPQITLSQRRALQLFCSKNEPVPLVWIKPAVRYLEELPKPIHFIDFEAATNPLPMRKEGKPYEQVIFQYSCHTLHQDGVITHSEWLDQNKDHFPHDAIIDSILSIPQIDEGTIVQYSPFERQAFVRLLRDLDDAGEKEKKRYDAMKQILAPANNKRFCDLNRVVRDGYYNRFMDNGLTLKQVILSIISVEKKLGINSLNEELLSASGEAVQRLFLNYPETNPFSTTPDPELPIRDGAEAMHAYLAMKSGIVTKEEFKKIPGLLRDYCTLDSYALFIIYRHLVTLLQKGEDEVVIFE